MKRVVFATLLLCGAIAKPLRTRSGLPNQPADFRLPSACSYAVFNDTLLFQADLPNQPVATNYTTLDACAAACCATGYPCATFSMTADGACYLKQRRLWTNISLSGVRSGVLLDPAPKPVKMFPWFNMSLTTDERLDALVDAMTLTEQIEWINDGAPTIARLGLPSYSFESEASHGVGIGGPASVFPAPVAMGASFDTDLVHRVAAATAVEARAKWLHTLADDGSSDITQGLHFSAPNNNVAPMPTWGRIQETTGGEDPTLASAMAAAFITGLQGSHPRYLQAVATTKHFFGYHIDSSVDQKQYRLFHSYNYSTTDMWQYYLKPFAAAVAANVSAAMCEYSGTQVPGVTGQGPEPWGVPSCVSPYLQRILRDTLGFKGYIISDMFSITNVGPLWHEFTATAQEAACIAINSGVDISMGGEFDETMRNCVDAGAVTPARIRQAVRQVMSSLFALGWFDTLSARMQGIPDPVPFNDVTFEANVSSPEHRALARTAAAAGFVLLKNANGALPLQIGGSKPLRRVALIGPIADVPAGNPMSASSTSYSGNYSPCTWYNNGPDGYMVDDPMCHIVSLREALANESFTLDYVPGLPNVTSNDTSGFAQAATAAAAADAIVLAIGASTCESLTCVEGESNDRVLNAGGGEGLLGFYGAQLALVQRVASARAPGVPLIIVQFQGGPISSPIAVTAADAILVAWFPGFEGGSALTDVLMGRVSPAGRMPVTMLSDASQLPPFNDVVLRTPPGRTHWYYNGHPLFPFGFGLSYASFAYTGVAVTPQTLLPSDASFSVTVTLTRGTGGTFVGEADEVVQLYGAYAGVNATGGEASVPRQQLLAFTRVKAFVSGEARNVTLTVARSDLALVQPAGGAPAVSGGNWTLWVGGGPPSAGSYAGGISPLASWLAVVPVS